MNRDVSGINILESIPQRPPFVFIDRLLHFDPVVTVSEFRIREDNLFLSDGKFASEGLVENIAQTCAARIGYANLLQSENVKLGFIGAIRNLSISRTPNVGEILKTTITVKEEVFRMTLVDAEVAIYDHVIAQAEMKIALSEIDATD